MTVDIENQNQSEYWIETYSEGNEYVYKRVKPYNSYRLIGIIIHTSLKEKENLKGQNFSFQIDRARKLEDWEIVKYKMLE